MGGERRLQLVNWPATFSVSRTPHPSNQSGNAHEITAPTGPGGSYRWTLGLEIIGGATVCSEVKGQLDDTMALLRRRIREHDQANGNPHLEMSADEGNALKRLVERLDEEHKQLMARIKKNGGMSGLR